VISNGYPYLSIAKKYNMDYAEVLNIAHYVTFDMDTRVSYPPLDHKYNGGLNNEMWNDIMDAAKYYRGVQAGLIPFPPT